MSVFDIIIPHYGAGELTEVCLRCLRSIKQHTDSDEYRIILVDNASPDPDPVRNALSFHPHLYVRNTENLGFIKATNQGIRLATAPYVVLMNNDAEAAHNWLEKMRHAFDVHPQVGLAGPLSTAWDSWQGRWIPTKGKDRSANFDRVHLLAANRMLAFFCVMIARSVFDKIGLLDESYGVGFGDDDEFCRRAERAFILLALVQDLRIPHAHRTTFKALYSDEQIRNMQTAALAKFKASR